MALVADHRIGTLVAGLVTLAAGAILVGMAPKSPLHRAAGLFFGLRGAFNALTAFSVGAADLPSRMAVYALIGMPAAAVWVMLRFRQEFGRRLSRTGRTAAAAVLLGASGLASLLYAIDHGLFFDGPFVHLFALQFLAYAAVALAARQDYDTIAEGPSRRALLTFTLGVAVEPAFLGAYKLTGFLHTGSWDVDIAIIGAAFVLAWLAGPWRRGEARDRRLGATLLGVATLSGLLCYVLSVVWLGPLVFTLPFVNAFWTVWAVAATAYASHRFRLFSLDLHVKAFLRYGSTTFLLAFIFWAASESIEQRFHANTLWQSLAAAGVIAVVLYPLQLLMRRLVERLMPGVARTDAYRSRRREEIYVAAVERARIDGFIDASEREALTMLGRGLGLSGKDIQRLEKGHVGQGRAGA